MEPLRRLLLAIARNGRRARDAPPLHRFAPFRRFFRGNGTLKTAELHRRDGSLSRRELLTRCLLLSAVLDQGPDIVGVRMLTRQVVNSLYRKGIRIFHSPEMFFSNLGVCTSVIAREHDRVKGRRARTWARSNKTNAERYNLFLDNTKQVLNYAVARWGVPLGVALVIEREKRGRRSASPLVDYLESYRSAEVMSDALKDDPKYGLGKAVGDKACHLFAKWFCSSFRLCRREEPHWGPFSYEGPFDSNAGRVLWRTGALLKLARAKDYRARAVIQRGKGKGGRHYLRITNIRGMEVSRRVPRWLVEAHGEVCVGHMRTHMRHPRRVQIQRVPHALLLPRFAETGLGIAELDDGLVRIGTRFCFNHEKPACIRCPVRRRCRGYRRSKVLIRLYRT